MGGVTCDTRGVRVACQACGQTNRLTYAAVDRHTRCGRCQAMLRAADVPIVVPGAGEFDALVGQASLPVAIDFWAPWCGPCRSMAPELDRVAAALAGQWLIAKVDTEALPALGERFRVRSIPTLAVFRGGHEITRMSGALPAAEIQRWLMQAVG